MQSVFLLCLWQQDLELIEQEIYALLVIQQEKTGLFLQCRLQKLKI